MSKEAMKLALEAAYLAGFNASGEGYNGEYPFRDHARNPEEDAAWIKDRDNALREALAEQPAPMIRGDIRDGLVDDEPAHQHIEHCLWARNGNQPCPHVQPAQQQEPVAKYLGDSHDGSLVQLYDDVEKGTEFYTSPPPRKPWVGLTDEDIKEAEWLLSAIKEHEAYTLQEQLLVEGVDVFARAIEAKLRERNA